LRQCVHDSGYCERPDVLNAGALQHARTRFERGTRGGDVVNQNDHQAVRERNVCSAERKRVMHVCASLVGRQIDLRPRRTHAAQHATDRQSKPSGEIFCLIEPTMALSPPMQRYGHDEVGSEQDLSTVGSHQPGQTRRDRSAAIVFQRVNQISKRSLVRSDRLST
jgi:hypothetical protein